jgi:DNA polymerase-3 subunit beta
MDLETEGEHLEVAFNSRYLTEFLGVIDNDRVEFESEGSLKPGVFRPVEKNKQGEFVHVIMPVRVAN